MCYVNTMKQYKSATHYVLIGLIPFSEPNLKLAFKPSTFFNELERINNISPNASRNALRRLHTKGLVIYDEQNIPRLTDKGKKAVRPYVSKKLTGSHIMVVFDVPEYERWKRRQIRAVLREFSFVQIQKSVWMSPLDCAKYIKEVVSDLSLKASVKIYESREI